MTLLHYLIAGLCVVPLIGCATPTPPPAPSSELLTSSAHSLSRFSPDELPSDAWRRAYHALSAQGWSAESVALHALFARALDQTGQHNTLASYDVYVSDKINEIHQDEASRTALLSVYEDARREWAGRKLSPTPAQLLAMSAAERRAALYPSFQQLAFIEPVTAAMMRPSTRAEGAGLTMGDEHVDVLIARARELIHGGERPAASALLLKHEPDVDALAPGSLAQWLRARAAWHVMWRELGEQALIARHLSHPVALTRRWSTSEHIMVESWRCQEWMAIGNTEQALKACQRAIAYYPERFRRQATLSTQSDHLPEELLTTSAMAAMQSARYELAVQYTSWLGDVTRREHLHATIFETMRERGHLAQAATFAQEFLDDRDVLIATARHAQAHPEDSEIVKTRQKVWSDLVTQPDLYELRPRQALAPQLAGLLELVELTHVYSELEPLTVPIIMDAIGRLGAPQDRTRSLILLAANLSPKHPDRKLVMETIREDLIEYSTRQNAQSVPMIRQADHALFAELITSVASDAALVTLLLAQLQNAADAGDVLGMIEGDEVLRELSGEERVAQSARLLDLPTLRSPAEHVVLGAQLLRLFDDARAWDEVEARIFARRYKDAVHAEQLHALYASWFERKLELGADFDAVHAIIEKETFPEERDVMSAAIVDVLYERVLWPEMMTVAHLELIEQWRVDARRGVVYRAKLASLHARQGHCARVAEMPARVATAFPPALSVILGACRDEVSPDTLHGWLDTRDVDRHRFARELMFALIYEQAP
jgi:hypothetical protein